MNEDIKKRLSYAENHNLFDDHFIKDMKYLLDQNEKLQQEIEQMEMEMIIKIEQEETYRG